MTQQNYASARPGQPTKAIITLKFKDFSDDAASDVMQRECSGCWL